MLDAFRENPKKFMIMAGPLAAAMGEATGDAKSAIIGGVKGTITGEGAVEGAKEEVGSRGEYMQLALEKLPVPDEYKTPEVARVLENLNQAWLFGLPGHILQAFLQGGKVDVAEAALGPVAGEAIGLAADSLSGALGAGQELIEGGPLTAEPWTNLGRNLTRKVPYGIGAGTQRAVFPTRRQSSGGTKKRRAQ